MLVLSGLSVGHHAVQIPSSLNGAEAAQPPLFGPEVTSVTFRSGGSSSHHFGSGNCASHFSVRVLLQSLSGPGIAPVTFRSGRYLSHCLVQRPGSSSQHLGSRNCASHFSVRALLQSFFVPGIVSVTSRSGSHLNHFSVRGFLQSPF